MSNPRALIIEDEVDLADIFAKAIQSAGFDVQIIRRGDAALEWLSQITPDLVVLDLHLPGVKGTDILERIRDDEQLSAMRVIVATADPRMAEDLYEKADLILLKPIGYLQLQDLAKRLRTTILNPDRAATLPRPEPKGPIGPENSCSM
jgi:DNA-binding response OmpR family regulator